MHRRSHIQQECGGRRGYKRIGTGHQDVGRKNGNGSNRSDEVCRIDIKGTWLYESVIGARGTELNMLEIIYLMNYNITINSLYEYLYRMLKHFLFFKAIDEDTYVHKPYFLSLKRFQKGLLPDQSIQLNQTD